MKTFFLTICFLLGLLLFFVYVLAQNGLYITQDFLEKIYSMILSGLLLALGSIVGALYQFQINKKADDMAQQAVDRFVSRATSHLFKETKKTKKDGDEKILQDVTNEIKNKNLNDFINSIMKGKK